MAQTQCGNCGYPYAVACDGCPNCGVRFECSQGGGCGGLIFIGIIVYFIANSDKRLKRDIDLLGKSPSGINIYRFRYLDDETYYQGAMAQDLLLTHPQAVVLRTNGYLGVIYDLIDVEFLELEDGGAVQTGVVE